ncbi:MAG: Two component regulator three Y domain protein, partial [Winogradskyella sp.]
MKTLKLTLLCCLLSAFAFADVSKTQKEALIAIYNATNGNSWNKSWDFDQPVAKWCGLTLDKNDNIVGIDLSFNNLNGTLPKELASLTALKFLNLSFNKLEGQLPSTLTLMVNLEDLKLFSNNFSG